MFPPSLMCSLMTCYFDFNVTDGELLEVSLVHPDMLNGLLHLMRPTTSFPQLETRVDSPFMLIHHFPDWEIELSNWHHHTSQVSTPTLFVENVFYHYISSKLWHDLHRSMYAPCYEGKLSPETIRDYHL